MMNEGGVWVHAMNAEPREPVDEELLNRKDPRGL
jgi:hypothetical protein